MEKAIIEKVKKGDTKAFKKLYDDNVQSLYRFLFQFSGNRYIVEDWVQTTFIKAYKNIDRFEYKSKFSTWLFSIGLNEMRSYFRNKSNLKTVSFDDIYMDEHLLEEEAFEWQEDMRWLLSELDEDKKAVFILFEVEGFSHSEVSQILNISEASSRTTLSRTKQYLKQRWQAEMTK